MSRTPRTYEIAQCALCSQLDDHHSLDLLTHEGDLPAAATQLTGMPTDLGGGLHRTVVCPTCHAHYAFEIDVEPMVWDVSLSRCHPTTVREDLGEIRYAEAIAVLEGILRDGSDPAIGSAARPPATRFAVRALAEHDLATGQPAALAALIAHDDPELRYAALLSCTPATVAPYLDVLWPVLVARLLEGSHPADRAAWLLNFPASFLDEHGTQFVDRLALAPVSGPVVTVVARLAGALDLAVLVPGLADFLVRPGIPRFDAARVVEILRRQAARDPLARGAVLAALADRPSTAFTEELASLLDDDPRNGPG